MVLFGRADEQAVIDQLLDGARDARSGTLVIRGDAGIGKSALLDYAERSAAGMRVLTARGVETEAEFAFAGLHMLLRPVLDRIDDLPPPQAAALRRAFALAAGDGNDHYLAGLAVLSLLSDLAEQQPVLAIVDDAHWLDTASAAALQFAARRLDSEGVVLLGSSRDGRVSFGGPVPPELRLSALDPASAARLVDERAPRLSPGLRARILTEASGNPLALIELASHAGSSPMDGPEPLPGARDVFAAQLRSLEQPARTMLLLAAAEPTGDLAVIADAARKLGTDPEAVDSAERAGLVTVTGNRLEFRHPLIRSTAYHGAPLAEQRAAHRALAEALGDGGDGADRRAWHIATATIGRDAQVADLMEQAAQHALGRGGHVAAAAAYERAATLDPDPSTRARRLITAATAAHDGGDMDRAIRLADEAGRLPGDGLLRARLAFLRAQLVTEGRMERVAELPAAAARVSGRDPDLAIAMLTEASHVAWGTHDSDLAFTVAASLRDLLARTSARGHAFSAAVAQQTLLFAGDPTADRNVIDDYVQFIRASPSDASPRERLVASAMAYWSGDRGASGDISAALAVDCRANGMIGWLAGPLQGLAMAHLSRGNLTAARASALEGYRLASDTGQQPRVAFLAGLLAWIEAYAGDEEAFHSWAAKTADPAWSHAGRAQLDLAAGRFRQALGHLTELRRWWEPGTEFLIQPDLVEAAARSDQPDLAEKEAMRFTTWAQDCGHQWALAAAHRCQALVTGNETQFTQALRLHDGAGHLFDHARTVLLYGEWLRRGRRRADARTQLTAARELFAGLGAVRWAERARIELLATGARPGQYVRQPGPLDRLTPQELQVVRLAAAGLSNRDIAAQLFLSPRTVGYHLYKAYPKLAVTSRGELAAKFSSVY
jgi:DNA-binding CsgD family transcriptional regulator